MKKIDKAAAPVVHGAPYPPPFDEPCRKRTRIRLGDAAGLTQFGVNLLRLPPGVWSSQRHWHTGEDEFVFVVEGEVVLVTDSGEETFRAGDCASFRAGASDGHHFQNRSARDVLLLEMGSRNMDDRTHYSEIDMLAVGDEFLHRDGTPYPKKPPA